MKNSKVINRHYFLQLGLMTLLISVILVAVLLYGNLVKHDEYLLQALSISPNTFLHLCALLIPYALSFALPFGFVLALLLCYGKWSSSNQILALRSLGQGVLSWGKPGFFLSLIVSIFSLYTFLQWGPENRAKFDQEKSKVLWSNINTLLNTEKEIEFVLNPDSGNITNNNLASFSDEPIHRVSLSVGKTEESCWHNVRFLLFGENDDGENDKLLRIVNAKSVLVDRSPDHSKLILFLKNVDLESAQDDREEQNVFVSFEEWNQPLVFDLNFGNQEINLKRIGFFKLLDLSKSDQEESVQAKVLLQKSFALGSSSFFLSLVLLPLSITKGRKESISNLAIGIFISILYYATVTFFEEFSIIYTTPSLIWIPNAACFIIGSYSIYKFETPNR